MAEANLTLEQQFLSEALLVGDLNARDNSNRSLILITALLDEDFDASHIPGCSSSILAAAHHDGTSPKQLLLEYLLEKELIPRTDKIDALEMAGAVLLGNDDNQEKFPLGFQYWRRALALRLMVTEGCRPIYKTPTKSKSGQLSEWSTLDELDQIEEDPAHRVIQSLLVRLRIASSLCWQAVCYCFIPSCMEFLWYYPCSMSQLLDFSWTAVDTILRTERPHEEYILYSVANIERWILNRFKTLSEATSVDFNSLNSGNLQKLVELIVISDVTNPIDNLETPVIHSALHMLNFCDLIRLFSRFPEMMTEEIRVSLLELVRRDGRFCGFNLLHLICLFGGGDLYLPSIRLLVQLGAKPNARTNIVMDLGNGLGVLHILANQSESETRDAAARLLLDLGAHLDMADYAGLTATDYWLRNNNQERNRLPDWLKEDVHMLKCLSSRVVRRYRVPHDESNTPAVLIPFISLH